MRRTIRARATLTAVAVVGAAALLAGVALVTLLRQSLVRNVDTRAKLRLREVAAVAERGQLPNTLAGTDADGTVAQLVVGGGVVAQSPVVRGSQPLVRFVPPPGVVTVRTVHHPPIHGGSVYRVAATRVDTPRGPGVVYVAVSLEPVDDSVKGLAALLALVVPGLVVVVGATMWWLVGRTLDPVEAIRRQVAAISAAQLTHRVPEPGTGDEIDRLAGTMNEMLGRLEDALVRQRAFVSDAAHELRSPLAAIAAELEVAASHQGTADWPAVIDRLSATNRRMERLVEDLLVLATVEEHGGRQRSEVDLDDIVLRQLQPLRATSRLHLDIEDLSGARVWGDRDQLERVVANLLDNAERHAATTVVVALRTDDGTAELVIADDGPGIAVEHRERIFDRFARVDGARDRVSGGAGLGLAIARGIVERHGGTITAVDAPRGARLVVRLPVGAPPATV